MSLEQAEAVADLIASRNNLQQSIAVGQLSGSLGSQIRKTLDGIEGLLSRWRAAIDFPEHPTGPGWEPGDAEALDAIRCTLQQLIETALVDLHKARRLALCGAPNVGKSTLLNQWVGETRVLVDPLPGTTRDPVEVEFSVEGQRWSIWDTAGLRAEAVDLEAAGIALSMDRIQQADVCLWIVDPDRPVWPTPELRADARLLLVGGKADLASPTRRRSLEESAQGQGLALLGWVSGKTGEGMQALRASALGQGATPHATSDGSSIVVRRRHREALAAACNSVASAQTAKREGLTLDVIVLDMELAAHRLGQILGRDVDLEVLDRIFAEFCIGK